MSAHSVEHTVHWSIVRIVIAVIIGLSAAGVGRSEPTTTPATPAHFGRAELIEDARQLADAIESAHPDPWDYPGLG